MGFFRRMLLLQASSWVSSSPSPQDAKHLVTSAGPSLMEQPLEDVALELSVDHGHQMVLPGMGVLHGFVSPRQRSLLVELATMMQKLDCAMMDFIAAVVFALPPAQHQQQPQPQQQPQLQPQPRQPQPRQLQPQQPQQNNVLPKAKEAWNVKMEFVLLQHQLLQLLLPQQPQQLYLASSLEKSVGMALTAASLIKEDVAVDQNVTSLDCPLMITFAHEEHIDIAFEFYIIFCFSL